MKNKTNLYFLSIILFAILLCILRTACMLTSYNTDVGYFENNVLVVLTQILSIIGVAWCIALSVILSKSAETVNINSQPHKIVSFFAGFIFLISGIAIILGSWKLFPLNIPRSSTLFTLLFGIFTLLSSLFFFTKHAKRPRAAHTACGFWVLIFLFCVLFHIYFDMYVAINSPLKIALQLSILSAMIFILFEIRKGLGMTIPRFSMAAQCLCVIFCLPTAVSHLIFGISSQSSWLTKNITSPLFSLPLLALGIFAALTPLFCKNEK